MLARARRGRRAGAGSRRRAPPSHDLADQHLALTVRLEGDVRLPVRQRAKLAVGAGEARLGLRWADGDAASPRRAEARGRRVAWDDDRDGGDAERRESVGFLEAVGREVDGEACGVRATNRAT